MNAITTRESHLDLASLAADAMVDTGIFDWITSHLGRALAAIPRELVTWLGPELRTPGNSAPPSVAMSESGPWNGLVFIEADEASYWVLTRASPGKRQQPIGKTPRQEPFGQRSRPWPHEPTLASTLWPEDPPAPHERTPWDGDPWRR